MKASDLLLHRRNRKRKRPQKNPRSIAETTKPADFGRGLSSLRDKSALFLDGLRCELKDLVQQSPSVLSAQKMIQDRIRSLWVGLMIPGRQELHDRGDDQWQGAQNQLAVETGRLRNLINDPVKAIGPEKVLQVLYAHSWLRKIFHGLLSGAGTLGLLLLVQYILQVRPKHIQNRLNLLSGSLEPGNHARKIGQAL